MTATDRFKGWASLFFGAGADSLLGGFAPSGIAYLSANGSDTTGDGSPAKPFHSVPKALEAEFVRFHFLDAFYGGQPILSADLECWIDGVEGGYFDLSPNGNNVTVHGAGVARAGLGDLISLVGGSITVKDVTILGVLVGIDENVGGDGSTIRVERSRVLGETYLYGTNGASGDAGAPSVVELQSPTEVGVYNFTLNGAVGTVTVMEGASIWSDVDGWAHVSSQYSAYTSGTNTDVVVTLDAGVNLALPITHGSSPVAGTNGGNAGSLTLIDSELVGQIHIAAGIGGLNAINGDTGSISALNSRFNRPSDDYVITGNGNQWPGVWIGDGGVLNFYSTVEQ
jgi:hypothetical protein